MNFLPSIQPAVADGADDKMNALPTNNAARRGGLYACWFKLLVPIRHQIGNYLQPAAAGCTPEACVTGRKAI